MSFGDVHGKRSGQMFLTFRVIILLERLQDSSQKLTAFSVRPFET